MKAVVSTDGRYVATVGGEQIRIWEVNSSSLYMQFSTGGEINCLGWKPVATDEDMFVCAGVGEQIQVWSLQQGQRALILECGISVTCVSWSGCGLFSGGGDGHIVHWDTESGEPISKWKAFKSSVHSLCCHGDWLLSGCRALKLWHQYDYSLVKRFSGHSSAVRCLVGVACDHFLSAANDDRVVNVWSGCGPEKGPVCTLVCDSKVVGVSGHASSTELCVVVVLEDGKLQLFQVDLGQGEESVAMGKAVMPASTLQFVRNSEQLSDVNPVPVLCARFNDVSEALPTFIVTYGSSLRPVTEEVVFDVQEKYRCLSREVSMLALPMTPTSRHKSSGNVPTATVVGPGNMAAISHLPLTDRLQEDSTTPFKIHATPPSTASLGVLISQAITSGDDKLLEEVLKVTKEKLVTATVKKLPLHLVLPFMRKLIEILQQSPSRGLELSIWMKTIIACHTAYLISVPGLSASFGGLYEVLESRVSSFSKLAALQGKLNLLIGQAAQEEGGVTQSLLNVPVTTITLGESYEGAEAVENWSEDLESDSEPDSDVSMED